MRQKEECIMDIKSEITKIVDKLKSNPKLLEQFQKEPVKAVEQLLGVDLPTEAIESIVAGVKAKLGADTVSSALGAFKKLF